MGNMMDGLRVAKKVIGQTAKDTGKHIANAGVATGKYIKDASEVGQRGGGIENIRQESLLAPFRVLGNAGADAAIGTGKRMVKNTEPGIGNFYTGKRESGFGIAVAGVAAVGYGGYQSMKQTALAPKLGTVSYGGTAPIMDADGVSSTPQAPISNAPTLGANGNMVFGLHNARKG